MNKLEESEVIKYQLAEFSKLRAEIDKMPMKPAFYRAVRK